MAPPRKDPRLPVTCPACELTTFALTAGDIAAAAASHDAHCAGQPQPRHRDARTLLPCPDCEKPKEEATMTATQCSRCDSVSDCLDSGITTLEDVAGVIGAPAPSLHVHLVQHDRDDLLRGMTYGGEPILPFEPEPAAEAAEIEAVPEAEERSCACDKWVFDEGEDQFEEPNDADVGTIMHTEQACYNRVPAPEVLEVPSEWADEVQRLAQADADIVEAEILDADDRSDSLAWLVAHDDPEIREAAAALQVLIARKAQDWMMKAEIERLMVERDHLTQRIKEMQAALEGEPEPEAEADVIVTRVGQVHPDMPGIKGVSIAKVPASEIRAWCVANDVPVPQRGTLPRAAVEAYEAAHEVSA